MNNETIAFWWHHIHAMKKMAEGWMMEISYHKKMVEGQGDWNVIMKNLAKDWGDGNDLSWMHKAFGGRLDSVGI